ncbi:STAS domain-containing protein [Pseudoblastomonas halimionae]|uniref:STAS domain-containing protein n=1 Tax=Alteriqipengyuania halimionae TaxID=1926630 RepID=A0A6I4U6F2_9SPHN|nr:STAS domain-containing protein [Alteriqipengyuania halimionae]MXP10465.1 STAS domain-containing protein [Alteriqipengyuania halimionae]
MNSTPNPPEEKTAAPADKEQAQGPLKLPANGTTASAEELRIQLVLLLDGEDAEEIDASEVDNAGQAVLQLLVAAQAEAREAGRPLSFVNPSAAFRDRVERCRLTDQIGLDPEGVAA